MMSVVVSGMMMAAKTAALMGEKRVETKDRLRADEKVAKKEARMAVKRVGLTVERMVE